MERGEKGPVCGRDWGQDSTQFVFRVRKDSLHADSSRGSMGSAGARGPGAQQRGTDPPPGCSRRARPCVHLSGMVRRRLAAQGRDHIK